MQSAARGFQQRQHLRGLAHAHVVGQAAAETEAAQELHPADALALVVAQLSHEARGLLAGADAREAAQLVAHAGEGLVATDFGLRGQQRVEQPGLIAPEAQVIGFGSAQPGERAEAVQPLLRQQAVGAVVQPDHVLAAAQRRQQRGQLGGGVAIIHFAVQLKPVDAGGHPNLHGAGAAEDLALGFDVPAGLETGTRHGGQLLRRQPQRGRLRRPILGHVVEAELRTNALAAASACLSRTTNWRAAAIVDAAAGSNSGTRRPS